MKKHLLFFIIFVGFSTCCFAQGGTIQSLSILPTNPTSSDSITIYGDLSFLSTGCDQQSIGAFVFGNTVQVASHHCVGIAAAICYTTDSIKIAPLADGTYYLVFELVSGGAPIPCSPGIIADDVDTLLFTVGNPNALNQHPEPKSFSMYPNPTTGSFQVQLQQEAIGETISIYSADGRLQHQQKVQSTTETLYLDLENGMYWVQLSPCNTKDGTYSLIINR